MLSFNQKSFLEYLWLTSLFILTIVLVISDAYAAGVVGNGTATSCTDAALTKALTSGGTVTFNCGTTPKTISIGGEKIISANTVVDGGNRITLSGGNAKRIFFVKDRMALTVKNLTLANGYTAGQGAAIYAGWETVVTASRCNFINNTSTQLGEAGGGAIFTLAATLNIDNSKFSGNKASLGGAIRNHNTNLTVRTTTFTNNKAVDANLGSGGAIYIDGAKGDNGKILIDTSSFTSNTATSYGGAFFNSIYNNNITTINNAQFITNTVGGGSNGQGGAIWSTGNPASGGHWVSNANTTTLTITKTTMAGNTASQQGGGIFIARHPKGAVISQSTINGNKALKSMGGGIVKVESGLLSLSNSTVSNNTVHGTYSMGAGIYISNNAKAGISNSTIASNTANWQAGGVFGGGNVTLKNTILANNVALNGGNPWNIKHNCFQAMTNGGNNLQYPDPTDIDCTAGILTANPKLDTLKNNGGPTLTRALLAGSAASRKGANCTTTDQRAIARPKPAGTNCDIGAFEASL